jgi:5-methyltetrahydrofolate--homocysteine methyltransferase
MEPKAKDLLNIVFNIEGKRYGKGALADSLKGYLISLDGDREEKVKRFLEILNGAEVSREKHKVELKNILGKFESGSREGLRDKFVSFLNAIPLEKPLKAAYVLDLVREKSSEFEEKKGSEKKRSETLEDKIYYCVLEGDKTAIKGLLARGIEKYTPQEILSRFMIPAITEVGDLYEKKVYFLPQLLMSAEAMKKGMAFLMPYLQEETREYRGIVILATVEGDIHDIGKNIVGIMMENYGFKVLDLGKDVSNETILQKALEEKADIIALSALMTTTMTHMNDFMSTLKDAGHNIPVMVGGAVLNEDYAKQIGAHYAADAVAAVELADKLILLEKSK